MSDVPQRDEQIIMEELFGKRPASRARFYLHGAKDEDASASAGHPVFTDKVYVEIRIPDSTDFMSRPANKKDEREYPAAFAAFERAKNWNQHSLSLLPGMTPSILATLNALRYYTIEQLAAHDDANPAWFGTGAEDENGNVVDDPYPALKGALPESMLPTFHKAKRFVQFANKPHLRLVNGALTEVSNDAALTTATH